MRAQILIQPGELQLKEIPIPECSDDEVLIKIRVACICNGSDPAIFEGGHWDTFPVVFGHEACGQIIKCGCNVKGFKNGDRVSWWFTMGTFAEYVTVAPDKVAMVKIPEAISDDEGAILELVGATSRAIAAARIQKGEKILIIGLGPSGLIMSQLARNAGAEVVVGWDLYELRLETGLRLGCGTTMNSHDSDIVQKTLKEVGEFDVVIDAFADDTLPEQPTLDNAIKVMKTNGRIISYGHPRKRRVIDIFELQKRCIEMRGPVNDIEQIKSLFEKAVEDVASGKVKLKPLISGSVKLEDLQEGLKLVSNRQNEYIKVLVEI